MGSMKDSIYNNLRRGNLSDRIRAIRQLPNLKSPESLQVLEAIIKTEQNLGMKIEALTILPDIKDSQNYDETCRILELAISDPDPEVVRTALSAIQRMPRDLSAALLIEKIFQLLQSVEDADIQYYAILSLSHLHSQIQPEAYYIQILPFTHSDNAALREAATRALSRSVSDTRFRNNTQ